MIPGLPGANSDLRAWRISPRTTLTSLCLLAFLLLCPQQPGSAQGQAHISIAVQSSSFSNGGAIPRRLTCDGAGLSPNLQWSVPPAGTKSVALVMHDPDALVDFTHWLTFNIPPAVQLLAEGASERSAMPPGSSEGANDFDRFGYGGPCPPGGKPHHYVIQVYALNTRLGLQPGASRKQLDTAMSGHILAQGQIAGIYRRTGQ